MTQLVSQSVNQAVRVFDVLKFVTPRDPDTERHISPHGEAAGETLGALAAVNTSLPTTSGK